MALLDIGVAWIQIEPPKRIGLASDKAQFELPATSVVIDYYYTGRGPLDLKIDEALIEQLPAAPESWAIKQLIVRGLALGVQRRLIFDNPDYPRSGATESSLNKRGC